MKILMVNKFLHPNGGSETYIFKLGEQLTALGHEVQYFGMEHEGRCVSNNAEEYTSDMDFHGGSKLKKLTYPVKTVYSSEAKRKMRIVLDDFQPDIIHINNFNYQLTPSIIYAAQKYKERAGKKVKILFTAHDYQLVCPNHMMLNGSGEACGDCIGGNFLSCTKNRCIHGSKAKSIIGSAEATLYKKLGTYKYFDKIICCSEFLKSKMDTNPIFNGKTITMHNFIESVQKKEAKKEDYVLYFGRYSKEKGVETILDAKNISFVCAGSGDLEDKINEAPHITNVGFKTGDELEMLIRKAKCSVYPSVWYENCPFSVMESIMYGTPVVGADIGGIPELIENGKTGVLFKSGDSEDFERAINEALNKSEEMSSNCLSADFDTVETYCEKLLKIYSE
ncbi:MAG: glycosyltransferase family 4 protein [Eubacterium sp.]|nr:glycosyltransferase family 4 protein [Eubacterium sp.]